MAELHLGYVGTGAERRIGGGMRLADGSWIAFAVPSALHRAEAFAHSSLASFSAMALGIVLASVLVVRWITKPLRRLATAAEDFGKGAAPVPMPEDGPREVHDAARAFNAMQARIHRLVSDRTQALAAVSHDLRTPIQRLRLRAGFLDDAEARDRIDANLDEMEAMVEATLAYLREGREAEEPRPTDLVTVLRTVGDAAAVDALADRAIEAGAAEVHVEAGVTQRTDLVLLARLGLDELLDVGVVDVEHDHLGRTAGRAAGLDGAGGGVGCEDLGDLRGRPEPALQEVLADRAGGGVEPARARGLGAVRDPGAAGQL